MRWAALVVLLLSASSAIADAIVRTQAMAASTIAEIYVEDEFIRLELEIGLPDHDSCRVPLQHGLQLIPECLFRHYIGVPVNGISISISKAPWTTPGS